jgi:hypothetical protein
MAAEVFFSDDATLSVADSADTGLDVVGELKGVTFELTADHVTLYSGDSIERSAVKKRELEIPVDISVAAFDPAFAQAWMAGDSTTTNTSVTDTTDVAEFNLTGTFTTVGGGTTYDAEIGGVYFDTLPMFGAEEGEFIVWDISGTGQTVSNLDTQA